MRRLERTREPAHRVTGSQRARCCSQVTDRVHLPAAFSPILIGVITSFGGALGLRLPESPLVVAHQFLSQLAVSIRPRQKAHGRSAVNWVKSTTCSVTRPSFPAMPIPMSREGTR